MVRLTARTRREIRTVDEGGEMITGGTIATIIVIPILLVVFLIAALLFKGLAHREDRTDKYNDYWFYKVPSVLSFAAIPLTLAITTWAMYPWNWEYHSYNEHSGTVKTVNNQGGMNTKFVVTFTNSFQEYGVDDTRMASVKNGDKLTITCVRIWQYAGTDGYDCNYVRDNH